MAEQMGLGPSSGKGRRAMRGRQRRQRRAAAKGVRQRGIPEDVARRLGEANMLYASGECAPPRKNFISGFRTRQRAPPGRGQPAVCERRVRAFPLLCVGCKRCQDHCLALFADVSKAHVFLDANNAFECLLL